MDAELTRDLTEIEPELAAAIRRVFPDVPPGTPLAFRRLKVKSAHPIVVAETGTTPVRRTILKCRQREYRRWQSLSTECDMLTTVAPGIAEANPATRCPQVVGFFPERQILAVEMVEGRLLNQLIFGFGRSTDSAHVSALLRLCGEWLGRFHSATATGEMANPLEHFQARLAEKSVTAVFRAFAASPLLDGLRRAVDDLVRAYPALRRPLCTIHGMFVPFHVLVRNRVIYVFDLASCRSGFGLQDVATFLAYYDAARPWRRMVAARRLPISTQMREFLDAYQAHAGRFESVDEAILRLAHVRALVMFAAQLKGDSWVRSISAHARRVVIQRHFHEVCGAHLAALRGAHRETSPARSV